MTLDQQIRALLAKLDELESARLRVLVLYGRPLSGKSTLVKEAALRCQGHYVDICTELLPNISLPVLGAYGPDDLLGWIKRQANEANILFVDEIEPLLSTFLEDGARDFFRMLSLAEPKHTAIVVTRLDEILKRASFPADRVYRL